MVIHATFWPFASEACVAPDIDEDRDGIGVWNVGAPCQRMTQNPLHPSCWQEPEDWCFTFMNELTLTAAGACPDDPCKAEYVFDITYDEPCVKPCDTIQCCASGWLRVTDLTNDLGALLTGQTRTFNSLAECPCTEVNDHTCKVLMQVQCQELGVYYHELTTFGYYFTCMRCGP